MAQILPSWNSNEIQKTDAVPFIDEDMEKLLLMLKEGVVADVGIELHHHTKTRILTDAGN